MFYFIQTSQKQLKRMNIAVCLFLILTLTNAVEFILKPNIPTCTVLISSFDVITHSYSPSKLKLSSQQLAANNKEKSLQSR